MRLYTYVVRYDFGLAPNPFHGFCTLAVCKPGIRKGAQVGDLVLGTGSAHKGICRGGFAVYAMRVTETLPFDEYWIDERFRKKRPKATASKMSKKNVGDNLYHRDKRSGRWRQKRGSHNSTDLETDTSANRVLISSDFVYWGGSGPPVPEFCGENIVKVGPNYRNQFHPEVVKGFVHWIQGIQDKGESGLCGKPLGK